MDKGKINVRCCDWCGDLFELSNLTYMGLIDQFLCDQCYENYEG